MAEFCTRAERTACEPCLTASRDTFELWCARYVASLPPEDRQRIDSQIPDGIKSLAEKKGPAVADLTNTQTAPYPHELAELVDACVYRPGWIVYLRDEVRDPASTHAGETRGLTLSIITETINSYPPHQPMRVRHPFAVPAATYNRESWLRWLFERFAEVELHECMEFFTIGEEKPYAPNHGPGWDPYLITAVATTDLDRRTSFRGDVNAERQPIDPPRPAGHHPVA